MPSNDSWFDSVVEVSKDFPSLVDEFLRDIPDDFKSLLSMYVAFTIVEKGVKYLQNVDLEALIRNVDSTDGV